ncbi:UpxY family transcription antiterminator [Brumimicrobium mesophilum]|uniref:UpxY family transcription antiterminator n=1 Tax=Brumimicrobium mesophilum TaxID=392717 RepID=UPI000D144E39|nr:UpxY family transcription antiterminator [Brumimicrobium mesophilum]
MPWYVLITKPKCEKKVEANLSKIGVKSYCPTRIERRQWSDRIKKVEIPLLPSMILVELLENERDIVFQVPGSLRYLFWMGKPAIVSDQEIEILNEIESDQVNFVKVEKLQEGNEIDIENLGSESKKGVIKKISGNQCWVTLKNLGYTIKFNI